MKVSPSQRALALSATLIAVPVLWLSGPSLAKVCGSPASAPSAATSAEPVLMSVSNVPRRRHGAHRQAPTATATATSGSTATTSTTATPVPRPTRAARPACTARPTAEATLTPTAAATETPTPEATVTPTTEANTVPVPVATVARYS